MDEIETRLKESTENCLSSYATWRKDLKDNDARESLHNAVHELRKIATRLEIELGVSERDEITQKPIPIPPHRDSRGRVQGQGHQGNNNQGGSGSGGKPRNQSRRRPAPRKSTGGGSTT